MREWVLLLVLCAVGLAKHIDLPAPYEDHCILDDGENKYDPSNQFDIPWFNIDLDHDPGQRWVHIAKRYKEEINELIMVLVDFISPIIPGVLEFVDKECGEMVEKFPTPYREEVQSIADAAGMPVGRIVIYNIFYEIFTICTSVIAEDPNGNVYHARNLDFGLFLGWNYTSHEWEISSHLRKMIINVNWIQNGKILYKSNNFAGYIGIYNGLKPNKFSVTANERFMADGGYEEAKNQLSNTPMLSPVYYILGGAKSGEGCIITRSLNGTDLLNELKPSEPDGWYLVQTNYDQNTDPLYLDDRRTPGVKCMQTLGRSNVGFKGIFNMLSSRTNLNKLTTYTVLMHVPSSRFETHMQSCPGFCWPF